jgi:hypothetical protein
LAVGREAEVADTDEAAGNHQRRETAQESSMGNAISFFLLPCAEPRERRIHFWIEKW